MKVKINDLSKYAFINNEILLKKHNTLFYQIHKLNLVKDYYQSKVYQLDLRTNKTKQNKKLERYSLINKLNDDVLLVQKKDTYYQYDVKTDKLSVFFKEKNTTISKAVHLNKNNYLLLIKHNVNDKYEVIRRVPFYSDGSPDFNHNQKISLIKYDLTKKSYEYISNDDELVTNFYASNATIHYSYQQYDKDVINPVYSGLKTVSINSDNRHNLIKIDDQKTIYDFYLTNSNRLIVSINDYSRIGMNQNGDWYNLNTKSELNKIDNKYDISFWTSVNVDHTFGKKQTSHVDDVVYKLSTYQNKQELFMINHEQITKISNLDGDILSFVKLDDNQFIINYIDANKINELYLYNIKDHSLNALTKHNKLINDQYALLKPVEEFEFSNDGIKHKGYVIYPEGFNVNKKYPVVLQIHGGPKTTYSKSFHHEMRVLASLNAFVIFMNPRGSDGYGEVFSDIRAKYGTIDYSDLMKFVDEFKKRYHNYIDVNNMAVMGGSYGGFMTNWIITHTNQFKAAITQRSIFDWQTMFYNSDIALDFPSDQICKDKYDEQLIKKQSPSTYIKNAKTPTLIIHSTNDYRCPIDQAYGLYTALLKQNVTTKLCVFKNNSHGLSRNGTPYCRYGRLFAIIQWLNQHLDNFNLDKSNELKDHLSKHDLC
ncbi:S9 family peptidase [Mycoplasma sp. E35C]|uniref:alpha/beta hydrolase family protein n=1 Tax=Mycoplasma sp. E35C TaxID=2801918 RepID=UPI001CA3B2DA|nr:S9 family peptidase [Mycoplasma sp. E35C]QZX48964.1 S9 family peptidase [Mycoplasma sp. E35C]